MEERVSQLRPEIVWMVKDATVLQYLVPAIIPQDPGTHLKRLYRVSHERANHQMLDWLYRSQEPGKWTAFIQALKQSEYTYLANTLSSESGYSYDTNGKLLRLFSPYLEQALNPEELLVRCVSKDLISARDKEEISARQRNEGRIIATMMLLERIQIHLPPNVWYHRFLQVLHESNYDTLLRLLEPDFDFCISASKETNEEDAKRNFDSAYDDQDEIPYDKKEDMIVKKSIEEFREEIVALINVTDILNYLEPSVLDQAKASSIRELAAYEPNKASDQLLDLLLEESASTRRQGFVSCIRRTDYQYISKLLTDPWYRNYCSYLRKFISIFEPTIQTLLNPADIVSLLECEGVINQIDKSRILSTRDIHGNTAAAMTMLDCIQCRLEPHQWYTTFLNVLVQTDNCEVVNILEPDFLKDPDNFTRKIYEKALEDNNTHGTCLSKCMSGSSSKQNINLESVKKAQEHLQIFEKSVYRARQLVMKEKQKKENSIVQLCKVFEETVEIERHKVLEYISKLNKEVNRNTDMSQVDPDLQFENRFIPGGLTGKIKFKPIYQTIKLGKIEVFAPEPTYMNENNAFSGPTFRNISSKLLADTQSDSSSFLEVTGPQSVSSSSLALEQKFEDDIDKELKLKGFLEKDDYVLKSSSQNVTAEIQHYNISKDMREIVCVDIVEVNSESHLVGINSQEMCVSLFNLAGNLVKKIKCEKQFHRLESYSEDTIVLMSFTDPSIYLLNVFTENIDNLQCPCTRDKCAISSQSGFVYLFCVDMHLHLYRDDQWFEYHIKGLRRVPIWRISYVTVNADNTDIFVYSDESQKVMCIDLQKFCLKYEESFDSSDERILISGLICVGEFLLIFDKNNETIYIHTADNFLYKGEVINEALASCRLVARGNMPYDVVVICENNCKHISDENAVYRLHDSVELSCKSASCRNLYFTDECIIAKPTTDYHSEVSGLVSEKDGNLTHLDVDQDNTISATLSSDHKSETSKSVREASDIIYFFKVNVE